YTQAIEINKRDGDAYYNRGLVFVRMKKYEKAVKDFSETIKLEPRAADAYCNRGNANLQMGKIDMALKDYNAALIINPNDADLYHNRAVVYLTKGAKSKSLADFQKAAKMGHNKAREYLKLPPAKAKESKTPIKTSRVIWGLEPNEVKISGKRASGRIHGANFTVERAKMEKGILTLRQGKQVFPDYAVMIFLFSKKDEKLEGKTYNVSKNQGLGVPPIHMKWKQQGSDIPETEIFMKDYAMRLEFGKKERNILMGKIYLSIPDESKSFVSGTFRAKVE
ncbi:MAG: tetratricopeptide repeat protein, partial [Desulfatiglandales bacterium]